jgi:hypothetical protein
MDHTLAPCNLQCLGGESKPAKEQSESPTGEEENQKRTESGKTQNENIRRRKGLKQDRQWYR